MTFPFRPWVGRAGQSIVMVALAATGTLLVSLALKPELRFGWFGEPFVWLYLAALWAGGLRVWLGTRKPVATIDDEGVVLRPLHTLSARPIRWPDVLGTEQMMGGDRLILYYRTSRGMRLVALNLNLVKDRRGFLALVDDRLRGMGFVEKVVDRSRYLSRQQ